jgi:iron(III) transport system substrate-binding protein
MLRCFLLAVAVLAVQVLGSPAVAGDAPTVRVITDRTEAHLKPLFAKFTAATGTPVEAIYVDKGLLSRVKTNPTEADVVITAAVENLERARVDKLLRPYAPAVVGALPAQFQDEDRAYAIIAYRARGIFASKERVPAGSIATYEDLISPKLKGKVLIRSGVHDYNIAFFSQLAESRGMEWTKRFIAGLKENRARVPKGGDRDQVRAVRDGEGDVAVGNSYYMAIMLNNPEQKSWAEAVHFAFPDQQGKGAIVMKAGAALTTADRAVPQASALLGYLVGPEAQAYFSTTLNEYPVLPSTPISEFNKATLGAGQSEVKDGRFTIDAVSVRAADKHRDAIVAYLNEIAFDQ